MMSSEAEARSFCAQLVDASAMAKLDRYVELLAHENKRQNLVSNSSLQHIWQRHIADSLQLLSHAPAGASPWLDLGTGAGPPGMIIGIARPGAGVILVESRKRRADWLRELIAEFDLHNCQALADRLEDVPTFEASVVSARAFAPLDKLLHLASRFSTPETIWLLPKGRSAAQELAEQDNAVQSMFHVEHSATDPHAGLLIGLGRPASA